MDNAEKKGGSVLAIVVMFALFFMIAFVTNFAGSMGVIVKNQFGASNAASQLGSCANFFAYLFMGIPGGLILKRRGYKFTAILATVVGFLGVGVQLLSGYVESFNVYVTGAFIAGFSMCLLNLVVNPLLNTLGGEGKKGNQLVQFGSSLNSIGGTIAPILLGYLIGGEVAKAKVADAAPALLIAMGIFALAILIVAFSKIPEPHMETAAEREARLNGSTSVLKDIVATLRFRHFTFGALAIFFYIVIECGIPNMANLYMTEQIPVVGGIAKNGPGYVGAAVAGSVVAVYWFLMMCGRILGGIIGGKVSSKAMVTFCAVGGIVLMLAAMYSPVMFVELPFKTDVASVAGVTVSQNIKVPLSMIFAVLCGACTSVMWGAIFNLAAEGLGKYVPMGSGIFMCMVFGGVLLPVQGMIADAIGILNSYWLTIALFAYVLVYAHILSIPAKRAENN